MRESRIRQRDAVEPRARGEEGRRESQKKSLEKSIIAGLLRPKDDAPKRPDLLQLHGTIGDVYSGCDMIRFTSLHSPPFLLIFLLKKRKKKHISYDGADY